MPGIKYIFMRLINKTMIIHGIFNIRNLMEYAKDSNQHVSILLNVIDR